MDMTCGADFIAVVCKRSGQTHRKLVNKNNYVVVHTSESGDESNLSDSDGSLYRGISDPTRPIYDRYPTGRNKT